MKNKPSYEGYEIGRSLTIEDLRQSDQVVVFGSEVLTLSAILKNTPIGTKHLIQYDSAMTLASITYFPCSSFQVVDSSKIVGKAYYEYPNPRNFRNDGISGVKTILQEEGKQNSRNISNKVITRIERRTNELQLMVRISNDSSAGYSFRMSPMNLETKFDRVDSIDISLKEVTISYGLGTINRRIEGPDGTIIYDAMVVKDIKMLDELYSGILTKK